MSRKLAKKGIRQPQARKSSGLSQPLAEGHHAGGKQQADWHAGLRKAGEESAAAAMAAFHRDENRPAPFAADADALQDAQGHQE